MTTKHTSLAMDRGIYDSPYDAFTNYMNILGDFIRRVNALYPADMDNEELNALLTTIHNQDEEISALKKEIENLQVKLTKAEEGIVGSKEEAQSADAKPARKPRKTTATRKTAKKE